MALNFPLNPTVGQQYEYPPYIYEWDGSKWQTLSAGSDPTQDLRNDLAADTGATLVGTSTGQTVQYELDNHTHTPAEVGALAVGGTAVAANKLSAQRSIALTGDATGSVMFDGSANVSITTTVVDDLHNHTIANIDTLQTTLDGKLPLSGGTMTGSINIGSYGVLGANGGGLIRDHGNGNLTISAGKRSDSTFGSLWLGYNGTAASVDYGTTLVELWTKMAYKGPALGGIGTFALDMGNSNIGGLNYLIFGDPTETSEGIYFPKTGKTGISTVAADYDTFRVLDSVAYLNTNKIYHEGFKQTGTIGTSIELGANVDLDTMTSPGVWHQSANAETSLALNYPEANAGSLVIYAAAGVIQEYRVYNSSRVWVRAKYSTGAWTAWAKQYNTLNKPTAAEIGALPDNGVAASATKLATARTITLTGDVTGSVSFDGTANVSITSVIGDDTHNHTIANVDNLQSTLDGKAPGGYGLGGYCASISGDLTTVLRTNCGFYNADAAGVTNEFNASGWCYYLNMAHGNAAGYNGTIAMQFNGASMGFRTVEGGVNKGWKTLIHNAQTTTFTITGTGHDYSNAPISLNGNGTANTIFPALGFHQPGLYAGTLQQRDAGTFAFYKQGAAAYANLNVNDLYVASDRRLKSDFAPIENALDKVCTLEGKTYTKYGEREAGLIAQDVQQVLPEAIRENDSGYLNIASAGVNALLVEAIKELTSKLELQQQEINILKRHLGNN